MLPPDLRDPAQARYATVLARVADAQIERTRVVFAEVAGVAAPDWAAVEAVLAGVWAAGQQAGADLAVAHLGVLTGLPGVAAPVAVDAGRLVADVRAVWDASGFDAALSKAEAVGSSVVFDGAADGAQDWADLNADLLAGTEADPDVGARPVPWLRVVSRGEVCGLCVQAASRVYWTPALRPIHDHCRCTVRPILPDERISGMLEGPWNLKREVDAQMADATERNGPARGARRQRSRASNVRVAVPGGKIEG